MTRRSQLSLPFGFLLFSSFASAQSLGTAQSFAVLAGTTVTNVGPTIVSGDLGVWPGTAVTGFPPGIVVGGTIHAGDAVAMQAQSDVTTAYNVLAGMAPTQDLTGQDLGGLTLVPGVYFFSGPAQLTGTLTLNTQGNPNSLFVFQIASTLITSSGASVATINGPDDCNIFWQVGSSATLGTATSFQGNILALTSISLNTGATLVKGRALARNGAVTLDDNQITAGCTDQGNVPPILNCPGTLTATAGVPLQFQVCASDADPNDVVTITATGVPPGMTFTPPLPVSGNPVCTTADWTPTAQQLGTFQVTFTATDTHLRTQTCTVTIVVTDLPNTPPILDCPGTLMASAGVPLQFQVCASDADPNDIVTITAANVPPGMTFTPPLPASGNPVCITVDWTPTGQQVGTFQVTFTATDTHLRTQSCTVTIVSAECHMVFSSGLGSAQVTLFGHLYDTQLAGVRRSWPVTMVDMPTFAVNQLPPAFYVQVLMYNPTMFPANPDQYSAALRVMRNANGGIDHSYHGTFDGIAIRVQVYTVSGQLRVRFPFTIAGM